MSLARSPDPPRNYVCGQEKMQMRLAPAFWGLYRLETAWADPGACGINTCLACVIACSCGGSVVDSKA